MSASGTTKAGYGAVPIMEAKAELVGESGEGSGEAVSFLQNGQRTERRGKIRKIIIGVAVLLLLSRVWRAINYGRGGSKKSQPLIVPSNNGPDERPVPDVPPLIPHPPEPKKSKKQDLSKSKKKDSKKGSKKSKKDGPKSKKDDPKSKKRY